MSITTDSRVRIPAHPGEVLLEEFLKPLGVSRNRLSREAGLPLSAVSALVSGQRAVTASTALRLGRYLGTTPEFWMNLQVNHDLGRARAELGARVNVEVRPAARAAGG